MAGVAGQEPLQIWVAIQFSFVIIKSGGRSGLLDTMKFVFFSCNKGVEES